MTDATAPENNPAVAQTPAMPAVKAVTAGYRSYALGLLLVIYIFNFVDRQVVNIVAEPIKNELGLKDWQIGMMSGLMFALFYTFLGLPIARLAETKNRPVIIASALAVWSGFTAVCGLAQNFWQLALARMGVGVGEAGCTPPAHSLITDYVPADKRASALAFYSMGTPIGGLVGTVVGGVIADQHGWRMAFFVCGLPGLILAVIALMTLVEPRIKQVASDLKARAPTGATFGAALKVLGTRKTFWLIAFAAAIKAFIGYGHAPFTASFFLRNHAAGVAQMAKDTSAFLQGLGWNIELQSLGFLSIALGLASGIGGAIGAYLGGFIADKFGGKDLRAYVSVPGIAALIVIPLFITAMLHPNALVAFTVLAFNATLGTLWYGPVYATAQSIVPPNMRATASAVLLFIINLIGLGLGPLAVGLLSDFLADAMGMGSGEGIRWALIISACAGVLAWALFWLARNTIREELVG